MVIGQRYSWWCVIAQSKRSRVSPSFSVVLFLIPVNCASLKHTLREALISLHCMGISVLCLQSFEEVQGCGSFLVRLMCFATLSI